MRKKVEGAVKQTIDGPKPKVCAGNEANVEGLLGSRNPLIRTKPRFSFRLFIPCNHEFQVKMHYICG